MHAFDRKQNNGFDPADAWNGPQVAAAASAALVAAGLATALLFVPWPLVLPILSAAMIALAAGVALIAWLRKSDWSGITYWDVAGALTFLGICAALLAEPEHALAVLEGTRRRD